MIAARIPEGAAVEYLLICLGLTATLVGVRGDTWDGEQHGWKKLTLTGWAALTLATATAVASGVTVYQEQKQFSDQRQHMLIDLVSSVRALERVSIIANKLA